ncbi:FAD-dependent oxidoreductase [Nitrosococcus wardiae]|uniref:FAD-dependent oxidoreductase n=1 Tax=Nitrosococcus wardiae TaxID=1814290 RepID=A0A4V1AVR7_9GAMM|nr:FAD-dependent oxidoreductase [Nitrosococcus wardiae]QBQ54075.1 FAD-dependent oxidoreductase [Nitrosococcus wardiae]
MADVISAKSEPYWVATAPSSSFQPLKEELSVDVAVIGGGIVGISAAALVKRTGRTVAVLEAQRVGTQVTGGSTAKITSQHRLIYTNLIKNFGKENARIYAQSNQEAIEKIAQFIAEYQIECDFERQAAYTYTQSRDKVAAIEKEVEVAAELGLPASLVRETSLPFPIEGAICFDHQAQFNPCKYLKSIAQAIADESCYVFEETRVLDVKEGTPCEIITASGKVKAKEVIVATHMPILDRGGFFSKVYPQAHLALAARLENDRVLEGMFISTDEPTHSIRTANDEQGTILIVVGPSFRPGHETDTAQGYKNLEAFVRSHFTIRSVEYRWMNMDYHSMDGVPYIGKLLPTTKHIYVATGFNAWGITNGTVAALILSDAVLGKSNLWAEFYDATRLKLAVSAKNFIEQNIHTAKDFIQDRLTSYPDKSPSDLAPGEGSLMKVQGEKIAAYKDPQGKLHLLSPVCTHMGCHVAWNNMEKSWDCSCHGSRFRYDGTVLHGPAVRALEPKSISLPEKE